MLNVRSIVIAVLFAPLLASCDLPCWVFGCPAGSQTLPGPAKQFPGAFWTAEAHTYDCGEFKTIYNTIADADGFARAAKAGGFSQLDRVLESNVSAYTMTQYSQSADAMYFSGHGTFGVTEFANCSGTWGPGTIDGAIPASTSGMPVSGRLKWIMLSSSRSAAGPPSASGYINQALANHFSANWDPAFHAGLHGVYGAWETPSMGTSDIDDRVFGTAFGIFAITGCGACSGISNSSMTVHDSWINALKSVQSNVGWAIWEDANASGDHLSGPGDGSASPDYAQQLAGQEKFYNPANTGGVATQSVTPDGSNFTVVPYTLANQSVDHTSLYNRFASQSPTTPSVADDGVTYTVANTTSLLSHEYGLSGAVVYATASLLNPMTISQSSAQSAALSFAQNTLGMPSDAVLTNVIGLWALDIASGNSEITGYEFLYQHASGNLGGGDAIIVDVNDLTKSRNGTTCLAWDWSDADPPQRPHRYCSEYNQIVTHSPYISYAYCLWRSTPSTASLPSTGQTSLTAQAAASYLKPNDTINGFAQGYWTPLAGSPSTLATPAWVFYVNSHTQVFVDAYYGGIIGKTQVE